MIRRSTTLPTQSPRPGRAHRRAGALVPALLVASLLPIAACVEPDAEVETSEAELPLVAAPLRDDSYLGRAAIRFANTATDAQLTAVGLPAASLTSLKQFRNGPDRRRGGSDDRFARNVADLWFLTSASQQELAAAAAAHYAATRGASTCQVNGTIDVTPPASAFGAAPGTLRGESIESDREGVIYMLRTSDNPQGGALAMRSPAGVWSNVPLPAPVHHRTREIVKWGADEWGVWILYQSHHQHLGDYGSGEEYFGGEFGFLTNWRGTWDDQPLSRPYLDCLQDHDAEHCVQSHAWSRYTYTWDTQVAVSRGGVATIIIDTHDQGASTYSTRRYQQVLVGGTRPAARLQLPSASDHSFFSVCAHSDDAAYVIENRPLDNNTFKASMFIGQINTASPTPQWNPRRMTTHWANFYTWYRGTSCASVDGNTIVAWAADDAVHYLIANQAGTESEGTLAPYMVDGSQPKDRPLSVVGSRAGFDLYYADETRGESRIVRTRQLAAFPGSSSLALTPPEDTTMDPEQRINTPAVLPNGARLDYLPDGRPVLETCAP